MRVLLALVIAGLTTGATPLPARAQQGVTDAEILLGGSTSFAGPLAFTGEQATRSGGDLYFKAVNDGGGIHGRKVRTVYYDAGYKPQEAVANTRKLLEQDGVFAIIAPQGTPPVVATLEYLEENRVPLLFPFQGSPITRWRKWVFSGMTVYDRQRRRMVDYLVGARKFGKFATLCQDDEYGKSFLTALEKDLGRHGLKLVATESVKRGVTDVSAQMAKLQAARPDVLFLVLTPGPGAQALRERQKIGWSEVVMVSSGPLTDERYLALAGDASEGVEDLSISFGGLAALSGFSVEVAAREIVALIGPNGAGKSTVFNIVTGLERPASGRVTFLGRDLLAMGPHAIARCGIARTFQNTEVFRQLTVLDNVLIGCHTHLRAGALRGALGLPAVRREEGAARKTARALLARLGLEDQAGVEAGTLPLGLQKRLQLARALAAEPRPLPLDEPAGGLHPTQTQAPMGVIVRLRGERGLTRS